jgi:hypothetical protein
MVIASPALQALSTAGTTPPMTSVLTTHSARDPPAPLNSIFFNRTAATKYDGSALATAAFLVPIKNSFSQVLRNFGAIVPAFRGFGT